MTKMPSDKKYIDIIRLIRSNNIGCINFTKALRQFGSISSALTALENDPALLGRKVKLFDYALAEKEYTQGVKAGCKPIAYDDPEFPVLLSDIYDSPPLLWTKGNINILNRPKCAIVGARNASIGGRKIAYSLAKNLGLNNFVTVSGLAMGIDTAAHQGAVKNGTIAVLASGANVIYPDENQTLANEIVANNGLIISEAPIDAPPQAKMFIKRNRIISGLSLGTVVIEAAEKSGSLSTAEFALEQNREIFAVPGSPLDTRASGTNRLLRNGAHWAENSDDVITVLQEITKRTAVDQKLSQTNKQRFIHTSPEPQIKIEPIIVTSEPTQPKTNNPSNILDLLSTTPIACDDLVRLTGMPSSELLSLLSIMELDGDIMRHSGNMITKVIKRG